MKREEKSDEEEERDEGGGEKRVGCSRLCEEEIKESKCTWEEGAWKRRINEIYSVFTRKTETETAENRCWLVLKVLERNAERLWTAPPAVKQDGGRHYVWRLGETGGRQRKASGSFFPVNRGLQSEEKSAALSDKSRMGPWRRQHPGEHTVKLISKSVGV